MTGCSQAGTGHPYLVSDLTPLLLLKFKQNGGCFKGRSCPGPCFFHVLWWCCWGWHHLSCRPFHFNCYCRCSWGFVRVVFRARKMCGRSPGPASATASSNRPHASATICCPWWIPRTAESTVTKKVSKYLSTLSTLLSVLYCTLLYILYQASFDSFDPD